jgi:endoglucanase
VPVLVAGPWAVGDAVVNVSYWSPSVSSELARLTGDATWSQMTAGVPDLMAQLTDGGARLPSDWARLGDGRLQPTAAPSDTSAQPGVPARYGLDAQRTVVWSAVSCQAADRRLAARWNAMLTDGERAGATGLTLDGNVLDAARNPLPLVAAAAAAQAADQPDRTRQLLTEAAEQDGRNPTYYGSAWLALGWTLLATDRLDPCPS